MATLFYLVMSSIMSLVMKQMNSVTATCTSCLASTPIYSTCFGFPAVLPDLPPRHCNMIASILGAGKQSSLYSTKST